MRDCLLSMEKQTHLKLAIRRKYADPSIVIVSNHNVTIHVNSDASRSLQLPWRTASNPKAHFELTVIGEYLQSVS